MSQWMSMQILSMLDAIVLAQPKRGPKIMEIKREVQAMFSQVEALVNQQNER